MSDFLDVLEKVLEINSKGPFSHLARSRLDFARRAGLVVLTEKSASHHDAILHCQLRWLLAARVSLVYLWLLRHMLPEVGCEALFSVLKNDKE